jgi:hypothetical protein
LRRLIAPYFLRREKKDVLYQREAHMKAMQENGAAVSRNDRDRDSKEIADDSKHHIGNDGKEEKKGTIISSLQMTICPCV